MKKILTILLLSIATLLVAQSIAPKKCNTCGKPLAQCQYKGKHPSPQPKPQPKPKPNLSNQRTGGSTSGQNKQTTGSLGGHEWVDLGLPSGTKWATMNVGANSPSDYGSYFAWGETSPKSSYTWENLKYRISGDISDNVKFSKYVASSKYGNVDGKKLLDLSDDAAYVNWGSGWRMPSKDQQDELREKCRWSWTTMGGHNGYKVVGPNGNSIFLPAAGYRYAGSLYGAGLSGDCWSSSLDTGSSYFAYYLNSGSGNYDCDNYCRCCGLSVRPVCQ